ncbi:4Fe-4S dicluster domain-containing protein [Sulfurospirillum arsenophilum]|uniref:4Fe-4S dicluster domain-containing protein n=1 Tax=Sulfurospirillum arsenophilum TaxID=56698 RepID=UPI0018DD9036|nr:4Fe-4S dicluster domain-containing protein [Sulfurospirillum arsenophilum]
MKMPKSQKGFLFDQNFCIGCKACEVACQVYHQQEDMIDWRHVDTFLIRENNMEKEVYLSQACHHCQEPACMSVCPTNAYTKRDDGIVILDRDKCIGCGYCMESCQYGAITLQGNDKKAQKCNMCAEKQDIGELPACIAGCPVKALRLVDIVVADEAGMVKSAVGFKQSSLKPSIRFYPKFRSATFLG